jgi:Mrp family chromosome partitioning ATPase
MVKLIAELEAVADVVLFDATPILVGADAVILASQTDGVVLVVSRRSTRREAARRAVEALRSAQSKVLGLVVNRGSVSSSGYYHYYRSQNREARKHFWEGLRPWRKKIVGLANKPYRPVGQERDS